jgi:hypothetical protein
MKLRLANKHRQAIDRPEAELSRGDEQRSFQRFIDNIINDRRWWELREIGKGDGH